ncbi:hypothetical protein KI387_035767, partial [Taxus chinensis]
MMANHCAYGRQCVWWVEKYLRDCVCGMRDYVSVGFGLISLVSWAVAEVPQIITNFKNGSTEGVSLVFLMTWVVGDLFNLIGCWLEPATLPTQFYTALLYTFSTILLVCQIIYYDYFCKCWKMRKGKAQFKDQPKQLFKSEQNDDKKGEPVKVADQSISYSSETAKRTSADTNKFFNVLPVSSLPIPSVSPGNKHNAVGNLYYTSARSLASSRTPTGSYMLQSRGFGRSCPSYILSRSSVDEEGLLTNLISPSPRNSKTILRSVASTILFVGGMNYLKLPSYNNITSFSLSAEAKSGSVIIIITGRKLLQGMGAGVFSSRVMKEESSSELGTWLGWLMAAIYMGGRLPQISLNIKRGTVEGLNPLMFMFALIGNATYVGSIIIRTLKWEKLKPNMPWLVDAGVCVLLDFI